MVNALIKTNFYITAHIINIDPFLIVFKIVELKL